MTYSLYLSYYTKKKSVTVNEIDQYLVIKYRRGGVFVSKESKFLISFSFNHTFF